jgi:hypothetical protein
MRVGIVVFAIWIAVSFVAGRRRHPADEHIMLTVHLVEVLSERIQELNEADRAVLIRELRVAGPKSPNGSNQVLLSFLKSRGMLEDAFSSYTGSVLPNGRPEFHDAFGRPLIVASSETQRVLVSLGDDPFEVTVPDVDGYDVLIWSVGLDGVNQSGTNDDINNWRLAQND